ncbi:MAG: DUF4838 domain-containing protein, partial [Planctomycetes bacterium]|nr:DUF4838 domain-containing protein [Planctomycetota bacterium]
RTTKQGLASERPFRGDRVFWFANEVARRVARTYPDRSLLVLAYVNYAEPPDTVRPLPNVVPFLCHYAPADYSRPINDPRSEPNRQFNKLLRKWAKIAPQTTIYSYVSKSMWWRLPRPVLRPFAADIKYFYSLGLRRYYCQSSLTDWKLDGPLYYVIGRLLWDPSQDPQAIADEWIRLMFGLAAESMAEFYRSIDESVRKTGRPYSDHPPRDVPGLYDRPLLDQALAALERAEATPADRTVHDRIAGVAKVFRYGYHMIEALQQRHRFQTTGDPAALRAAREAGEKALSYVRVREAVRLVESFQAVIDLGVLATGFGPPEKKGGRRCWNSDETGKGDGRAGWASFVVQTPRTDRPLVIEMDVWGTSDLHHIVINTSGDGRSAASGSVWTPIRPQKPLSGKERWETLVFRIPPEALAAGKPFQRLGFGGSDSQVWISRIRVRQ